MKRALMGIGVCVALAAPATASGALKTFSGKVKGGGKIGIEADVVAGNATAVTELRYKRVRAHCSEIGGAAFQVTFELDLPVNGNNRFSLDSDYPGGHLLFKGVFRRHARRVNGLFKDRFDFDGHTCSTGERRYRASRGPLPNVKAKRALRLAP
jgi:hypothetical protein